MGNMCSSPTVSVSDCSDFCPLRIATLYADIDESINKKKKIETIVEYFMRPYHGYNLDVLCIQGIRNYKILKEIVSAFKHKIQKFNDDNHIGYEKAIYLEYYPDIECNDKPNENDLYWSTSESEGDGSYYDKLIVSRHGILQSADVQIGTDKRTEIDNLDNTDSNDASLMINNNDSDEISNMYKYIQVVNLNVDGTFVSLYNVELEEDTIGISNNKERRKQIRDIKHIIELNRKKGLETEARQFVHGDSTYIASNRDIHIVVGMFHINELKNGATGSEYNKTVLALNAFDVHRWIAVLRKETTPTDTNVRFTKDTFTFLISKDLATNQTVPQDTTLKSQKLFEDHKMVIINSNINKHLVDMNQFTNYPEDTIFMLYKPNIELFEERRLSQKTNDHKKTPLVQNNPTRFMDQMQRQVLAERYAKGKKPHPVFGTATYDEKNRNHVDKVSKIKESRVKSNTELPVKISTRTDTNTKIINSSTLRSPTHDTKKSPRDDNKINQDSSDVSNLMRDLDKNTKENASRQFSSIFSARHTNQITPVQALVQNYSRSSIDVKDEVELEEIIQLAKDFNDGVTINCSDQSIPPLLNDSHVKSKVDHDSPVDKKDHVIEVDTDKDVKDDDRLQQDQEFDQDSSDDDANKEIEDMVNLHVRHMINTKTKGKSIGSTKPLSFKKSSPKQIKSKTNVKPTPHIDADSNPHRTKDPDILE